jgi:hypothetical protein
MKSGGTLSVQIQTLVFKNHFKKNPLDKEDPHRSSYQGTGGTSYSGYGMLRLIHQKSQEPIWLFEYQSSFGFGSRSSNVAQQIVDKLMVSAEMATRLQHSMGAEKSEQKILIKQKAEEE